MTYFHKLFSAASKAIMALKRLIKFKARGISEEILMPSRVSARARIYTCVCVCGSIIYIRLAARAMIKGGEIAKPNYGLLIVVFASLFPSSCVRHFFGEGALFFFFFSRRNSISD